jgi:hypothetical protein
MEQVANLNERLEPDGVSRRWSLGNNRVVRQAAESLAQYQNDPLYLAIVPDEFEAAERFFNETLHPYTPTHNISNLNTSRWGFVTWRQIDDMARRVPAVWPHLTRNFEWNTHQIYPVDPRHQPGHSKSDTTSKRDYRSLRGEKVVYVVHPCAKNSRVVELPGPERYFPESYLVPTADLKDIDPSEPTVNPRDWQPVRGRLYEWKPPEAEDPQPPRRSPVPATPGRVRILDPSWWLSAVIMVDDSEEDLGDPFHVFTHHLIRERG